MEISPQKVQLQCDALGSCIRVTYECTNCKREPTLVFEGVGWEDEDEVPIE
jgi:primosomal protein N'